MLDRRQFLHTAGGVGLLAASAAILAACGSRETQPGIPGSAPKYGGTARVLTTEGSPQDKLDPAHTNLASEIFMHGMLYNNLVAADENNQPIPGLAEHWESDPNGQRWTFALRQGVEFHDGRPFTSADAAFTIGRILDPALGSPLTASLSQFLTPEGIQTPNPSTLVLNLERPNSFMPNLLGIYFMRVVPANVSPDDTKRGIGTGPFKLKSFEPGSSFEVEKNPNYWTSGRPYLDGVQITQAPEAEAKLQAVLNGEAHLGDTIAFSAFDRVQQSPTAQLLQLKGGGYGSFVLTHNKAPGNSLEAWQAFKHAMNREEILKQVYFGHGTVTPDVSIPPNDPYFPQGLEPLPYDPDKAKSLLVKVGFPNGIDVDLLTTSLFAGQAESAVVLKELFRGSGININVQNIPGESYYTQVPGPPFFTDVWLRGQAGFYVPLKYGALGPYNETGYTDPRISDLVAKAQRSTAFADQKQAIGDIFAIVNAECGEMSACHFDTAWVGSNELQGVVRNPAAVTLLTDSYLA